MSKAHALLGLIAEGGNTGFWTFSPNTQTAIPDAVCCNLLGCGQTASSISDLLVAVHGEDKAALLGDIESAITLRSRLSRSFRLHGGDGARLSMRGRWSVALNAADGEFICVVERMPISAQLTQAVEHRFEQLRHALKGSPVVLYEQDAQLRYEWVMAPRVGLEPDAIIGKVASDFLEPESARVLDQAKQDVMDSGKPVRQRLEIRPKGHPGGTFDVYMAPRLGSDGRVNGVISVALDRAETTAQELRMLAIFEHAPFAITLSRQSDGVFVKANANFLELMGYTEEEVLGSSTMALGLWHPPEERDRMLAELIATGRVRNMIGGYRKKSGKTGKLMVSVEPVTVGGEQLILGMMTDISALEEARQSLALSEARYRLLSEASFEGIGLAQNGTVLDANEQIAHILGVKREDLIGQPVTRNMKPTDKPTALKAFERGGDSSNEYEYLRPDGSRVIVEVRSKDLVHGGETLRISALRDVTEKKQKERALHNLQLRFSHMMESNVVGIFIAGADGEIFEANDYFLNMLGLERQALEAGQLNWRALTTQDSLDVTVRSVQQMMQSGGSLPYEKEYLHADGHRVSALVALSQLSTEPARGIVIVLNISDLKATQKELLASNAELLARSEVAERAEAAKTLFLSSISHELRTPLHTMLGHVRLMRKKASGEDLQQLSVVERSSTHLLRLIDDLLEYNHSTLAPEQLEPEMVMLDGFLASLQLIGEAAIDGSDNQFFIQLGDDLPDTMVVDEGRLTQVLRILIDNARKYTRHGVVIFSLALTGDRRSVNGTDRCSLCFSVEDNGRGMEAADVPRIFEPLHRGSNSADAQDERQGLGLGLAIAAQWIERMGSRITVQTTPGVGSSFSFVLDLAVGCEVLPVKQRLLRASHGSMDHPQATVLCFPLTARDLDTLCELIHMGRLGRLRDWANTLAMRYPQHQGAAGLVDKLASEADIVALETLYARWAAIGSQDNPNLLEGIVE